MRRVLLALCLLFPSLLHAQDCTGRDHSSALSPAQQAELAERLSDVPYQTGNHWIAERGNQRFHLVGTIHVYDPRLHAIADQLSPIIQTVDKVLVEATPEGEAQLQAYLSAHPELIRIPGPSLIERLPADIWQAVASAARERGIPPAVAAQMQPWFLSLSLAIPPCATLQLASGKRGLDHQIIDTARTAGTPVEAIEPFTTLIDIFSNEPIPDQIQAMHLGLLSTQQSTDGLATLKELYFAQNHTAIMPISAILARDWLDIDKAVFDAEIEKMLDGLLLRRNRNWMDVLRTAEGNLLVAVGAAHLGGHGGLLELLSQEGFSLTRAPF